MPTKRTIYFGTWINAERELFDTSLFTGSFKEYTFQGGAVICCLKMWKWTTTSLPLPLRKWQGCLLSRIQDVRIRMTGSTRCSKSFEDVSMPHIPRSMRSIFQGIK
jgi:hypothetical protein